MWIADFTAGLVILACCCKITEAEAVGSMFYIYFDGEISKEYREKLLNLGFYVEYKHNRVHYIL